MTRTKRREKTKHCDNPGCEICRAGEIEKAQNRAFKKKKAERIEE